DHDIVIFSPAVSVGVSFDLPSHINEVFGVFINNLGTGGSDDAIQSLARIRKPINQLWTITLDNETQVYNAKPSLPVDIIESLSSRLTRSCFLGKVTNLAITDEESRIMELYATVHHENMIDKNSFNANFTHTLDQMGITINEIGLTTPINNESKELTKQHKEDKKQEAINIKTNSAPIDHAEYERITSKRKFKPDEVTMQESGSLERFIFERKYSIDCDLLNKKEIELYLAHDDNGTISKLINREIAHAPKDFIKNYMNARIRGLGANGAFQVDLLSNKLNLPMLKQVLGYALPYTEGATYDHQSLKRSPMARFVAKHEKEIKALEVITLPRNWKQKPALLLNHLLDLLGYGHSSKQTNPKKGKRIYSYQCQLVDANEAL
ncbi:MAG: hypothetical protein KAG86_01845, partial [Gammaproteobacteria bacterium]|nr:hypothetical protein [Gammaproteobacteria bacterium]